MSEQQAEGFGAYYPEAAHHPGYNEAMADWRNQVRAMSTPEVLQEAPPEPIAPETPVEPAQELQEPQEDEQRQETEETEGGGQDEEQSEPFDPSAHNAPQVLDHLKAADRAERQRVLDAEEQGKARRGILNFRDELLQQDDASSDE